MLSFKFAGIKKGIFLFAIAFLSIFAISYQKSWCEESNDINNQIQELRQQMQQMQQRLEELEKRNTELEQQAKEKQEEKGLEE